MQEKIIFKKIDYRFPVVFSLIEGIALLIIAFLKVDNTTNTSLIKNFFGGLIVGFFSLFFILLIINSFLEKKGIFLDNKRITKIDYLSASVFSGVFLAFLFLIESLISPLKKINLIFGNSLVALIIILLTVPMLIFIYNKCKIFKKISFIADKKYFIQKISLISIILFGALYEMIFLPISAYLSNRLFLYNLIGNKLGFALIGLIAGFISSLVITLLYNNTEKPKIYLEIVS